MRNMILPATLLAAIAAFAFAQGQPSTTMPAQKAIETIDEVKIGDEANEKAHGLKGDKDETGDWSDRTYRHSQGGSFSWDLKVTPGQDTELRATYWGSDQRSFDIYVDGKLLKHEQIRMPHPDEFFEQPYLITADQTKDKEKVTIKFQAQNANGYAGGVFGLRTVKPTGAATAPAATQPK